jgi:hypothetical protein
MWAGLATRVITPELPVYLAGYGDRRDPATTIHDDLEARVLVLDAGDARACLVSCDLLAMTRDFSDPIRRAVAEVVDVDADHVLTSCTHVHAGPSALTGTDAIGWPVPDGYRERLVTRIAEAARTAVAKLTAVEPKFARAALPRDTAINRRGHALAPTAAVLVLEPVAVVANFGIHATLTGPSNLAIATDWVGPFRRATEARTGLPAVFLQGCQGDVNPSVTAWDDGDPSAWCSVVEAYAQRLAASVADAVGRARPETLAPIDARRRTVSVPVANTLLSQLAGAAARRSIDLVDWTLGDVHVVAVPGEGFHGVEAALRARYDDPLLIAGLAPDWHGYFPVPYTDGYEEGLSFGPEAVETLVASLIRG